MSSMAAVEREALDAIETRLTSAGYRLVRRPEPLQLPDFLRDARPTHRSGRPANLLIEVLRRPAFDDAHVETGKIGKIKSSLAGHPDWRLEVVLARHSVTAPRARARLRSRCASTRCAGFPPRSPRGAAPGLVAARSRRSRA